MAGRSRNIRGSQRHRAGWLIVLGVVCLGGCTPSESANRPDAIAIMGTGGASPSGEGGTAGTGGSVGGTGGDGGTAIGTGGAVLEPDAANDVPMVTPPSANGVTCSQDSQCESGFCTDKVCCAARCDGICRSCSVSGSLGVCLPAEVGTDPRNDCPDETPASCGRDGTCDGAGQCRTYSVGTICKPATCVGSTLTAASRCAADGCGKVNGQVCDPFVCGPAAACLTTCTKDGDCIKPNTCLAGRCGKKPLGDKCIGDDECNSAHCAQGVCCGSTCTANCQSCAVAGSEGRCTMVPVNQDPLNQCTKEDAATCGLNGACDGAGACQAWVAGTICKAAACNNATQTLAATCDGKKTCGVAASVSCADYTCDTNARCRVRCASTADCVSPAICDAGACGGVIAQYYGDMTLTSLILTRTEPGINNNFGPGSPPGVPADMFSARYTGTLTPRFSETYTFSILVDDGVRMWVNDSPIIDDWNPHAAIEDTGTIMLQANVPAKIRVEYFEKMGDAEVILSWSSPSEPKAVIPTGRLSPR